MSLHPQAASPIPEETARVARAAFPNGNPLMLLRDELGMFAIDQEFAGLFPPRGQPAVSPSRLFFITIMQFMEGLTDRQAADAVRSRIDWKYALGLPLTDAGFDFSVLSEFRARLLQEEQAQACLTRLLTVCQARGWLKARGRQRTDSTHILAAVRMRNRLECVGEARRHALDALAVAAPEWLSGWIPSEWYERYRTRITDFQLPKGAAQRLTYGEQIGGDGVHLLQAVAQPPAPAWLCDLPALVALRQIWAQQFVSDTPSTGRIRWRPEEALPPAAELIQSPHDLAARYSTKRATSWLGYKVHLTPDLRRRDTPPHCPRRHHSGHHPRYTGTRTDSCRSCGSETSPCYPSGRLRVCRCGSPAEQPTDLSG